MAYGTPLKQAREWQWGPDTLYRVEAVSYAVSDQWGDYSSTAPALEVTGYDVLRWTDCGATLKIMSGARHKWVNLQPGAKQWASHTIDEAVEQFMLRRKRQIYILERQLARARYEMKLAEVALGVADDLIPIGG